jgi:transposase
MTVRTVSNLPAATHGETERCLFAIELSKQSWIIGFITPLSTRIGRRILSGGDWKGLLKLIDEVRARVSREMGRTVEVMSCYEAGYDGFWLHRQLEAHGVRNYVIDPASLQVDRRMRRVKTDRIDTERLLRSLMAYLRGEPKVWSVVRVPSIAEEDARRLHRERDRLSPNAFNTSTASKGFARSKASTITIRCTRKRWRAWSNCARPRATRYRRG